MTLIVTALTRDYVLIASDRRLTVVADDGSINVADDNTCKLVSFCNSSVIGYTGRGSILGVPTHIWVARTLATHGHNNAPEALKALQSEATQAFKHFPPGQARHTFLSAGWLISTQGDEVKPYVCIVSNIQGDKGWLAHPKPSFDARVYDLAPDDDVRVGTVGATMQADRMNALDRNLKRLVARDISPHEAIRLMVDEILYLARHDSTVGNKVLAACIPRSSLFGLNAGSIVAKSADLDMATFAYFEDGYSELKQFGPTLVCGASAATSLETSNSPDGSQSVSVTILPTYPKRTSS